MPILPLLMLAGAASAQSPYPVEAVLHELSDTCFADGRLAKQGLIGPISETVEYWEKAAERNGWQRLTLEKAELSAVDRTVIHGTTALNAAMFGSFAQRYMDPSAPMLGGQLFRKSVAGRMLYLSLFGAEADSMRVAECRIHDPLGDGIAKNPVRLRDIQALTPEKVKKLEGPYASTRYRWAFTDGMISEVDVHFGFKGWALSPFSMKAEAFDPYVPYGMTLVAGFHEQEIII